MVLDEAPATAAAGLVVCSFAALPVSLLLSQLPTLTALSAEGERTNALWLRSRADEASAATGCGVCGKGGGEGEGQGRGRTGDAGGGGGRGEGRD